MDGAMPGCPRLYFGIVDVRDVADLHMRCMTDPAAKGERFLAVAGEFLSIVQIARILQAQSRAGGQARADDLSCRISSSAWRRGRSGGAADPA
jgi:nucleoside-diphosphate-sugar epimerase